MGRNDTGPPWSVTNDDDERRQTASLVWPPTVYVGEPEIILL